MRGWLPEAGGSSRSAFSCCTLAAPSPGSSIPFRAVGTVSRPMAQVARHAFVIRGIGACSATNALLVSRTMTMTTPVYQTADLSMVVGATEFATTPVESAAVCVTWRTRGQVANSARTASRTTMETGHARSHAKRWMKLVGVMAPVTTQEVYPFASAKMVIRTMTRTLPVSKLATIPR